MLRAIFTASVLTISTALAQNPDPAKIIEGARVAATLQQTDLSGSLSKNGKKTPVQLFLRGKDIQFALELGGPTQRFHLRLGDGEYNLFDVDPAGKTTKFPDAKLVQPIAGTDVTYEDLSFQFFYWPNPSYEGTEDVGGQPCYKIRLNKPAGSGGQYEVVYVWVHTSQGAFMKVCGFNKLGRLLKGFVVEDIMSIGNGVYTLRKMKISTYDPASDPKDPRTLSYTNLLFEKPTAVTPGKR
jgi:hypothetical protein